MNHHPAPRQCVLAAEIVDDRTDENRIGRSWNQQVEFPGRRPEPVLPACVIAVYCIEDVAGESVPVTFVNHVFASVPAEPAYVSGKRTGIGRQIAR